jgi:hypothetical protein
MAPKDPKINKQGTAGKKKHGALIIPHDLETITRFESGKS